jgi:hypothetical protein
MANSPKKVFTTVGSADTTEKPMANSQQLMAQKI